MFTSLRHLPVGGRHDLAQKWSLFSQVENEVKKLTMIPPSIWAAPVIMFLMSVLGSGRSRSRSSYLTVSMSWAINVTIMSLVGFILDVCRVDGDTTSLFFGCLVDLGIVDEGPSSFQCHNLGYRSRKGGLIKQVRIRNNIV
jgi:hypothetical protein